MFDREGVLLAELGRRLREARTGAGLTVSELARVASTSRRYITEAEAGRANLTIVKLAQLSEALAVPLGELCDLPLHLRGERIALVGLRGAGKSTVGPRLALALDAPFVELDARIERLAGMTLAEIFDLQGSAGFHALEAEALEQVLSEGERLVVAAGGSIVDSASNFARLLSTSKTVWLRARPEEHFERVQAQGDRRPMANRPRAMEELQELLRRREPAYSRCDHQLSTSDRDLDELVADIVSLCDPNSNAPR